MPDAKRAADEPAHAGAGDQVDRDAMLLEPAHDADVRQSARAAAAECDADALAGGGCPSSASSGAACTSNNASAETMKRANLLRKGSLLVDVTILRAMPRNQLDFITIGRGIRGIRNTRSAETT